MFFLLTCQFKDDFKDREVDIDSKYSRRLEISKYAGDKGKIYKTLVR